jgi:hypothetical protein
MARELTVIFNKKTFEGGLFFLQKDIEQYLKGKDKTKYEMIELTPERVVKTPLASYMVVDGTPKETPSVADFAVKNSRVIFDNEKFSEKICEVLFKNKHEPESLRISIDNDQWNRLVTKGIHLTNHVIKEFFSLRTVILVV